jgi:hypothetical protein
MRQLTGASDPTRRLDVRFAALLAACAVLALLLWATPLLVPFRLFVTVVHEMGHAIATVLTGGQVTSIEISPGGGGLTHVRGGNFFLSVSAGYLGSSLFGAALLLLARAPWRRRVLQALAVGLVLAVLFFFREPFGILVALLTAAAFWALAARGPDALVTLFVALLAVLNGLYAVVDLLYLLQISGSGAAPSDAAILQRRTGIPAVVWALLWTAIGVLIQLMALRTAVWRPAPSGSPAGNRLIR